MLTWTKATTGGGRVATTADRIYRITYDGSGYTAAAHDAANPRGRPLVESFHRTAKAARAWCQVEADLRAMFVRQRRVA